jgi:uncharacterized protein with PQ loop repeat
MLTRCVLCEVGTGFSSYFIFYNGMPSDFEWAILVVCLYASIFPAFIHLTNFHKTTYERHTNNIIFNYFITVIIFIFYVLVRSCSISTPPNEDCEAKTYQITNILMKRETC